MKFDYFFRVILFATTTFPTVVDATEHGATNTLIERVRNECGFDLRGPFASAAKSAAIDKDDGTNFRAKFDARPSRWNRKSDVQFSFNCWQRNPPSDPIDATQESGIANRAMEQKSSSAIIQEEDSGGRYFRHVSFEKKIVAANWRGTIAYVDGLVGDGHRTPMTYLLACDELSARSCIEINVEPAIPMSTKNLKPAIELTKRISHHPLSTQKNKR